MITSQIDTAPKPYLWPAGASKRLITSQIDTAPKPTPGSPLRPHGLITSQIDTAPKLIYTVVYLLAV